MRKARGVSCAIVALLLLLVPTRGRAAESSLTLYGGLFGNREYVQAWEGLALSLGLHEYVSAVGRITGVHYLESDDFNDGSSGLGEGGFSFHVAPNTSITALGGYYFGDIEEPIIDGWASTAQLIGNRWFNFSVGGLYGFDSYRWQTWGSVSTPIWEIDEDLILFGGVEAVVYNEGRFLNDQDFVFNPDKDDVRFQTGPMLELHKRSWDAGLKVGAGGGNNGVYGTASVYKRFGWGS